MLKKETGSNKSKWLRLAFESVAIALAILLAYFVGRAAGSADMLIRSVKWTDEVTVELRQVRAEILETKHACQEAHFRTWCPLGTVVQLRSDSSTVCVETFNHCPTRSTVGTCSGCHGEERDATLEHWHESVGK